VVKHRVWSKGAEERREGGGGREVEGGRELREGGSSREGGREVEGPWREKRQEVGKMG